MLESNNVISVSRPDSDPFAILVQELLMNIRASPVQRSPPISTITESSDNVRLIHSLISVLSLLNLRP